MGVNENDISNYVIVAAAIEQQAVSQTAAINWIELWTGPCIELI